MVAPKALLPGMLYVDAQKPPRIEHGTAAAFSQGLAVEQGDSSLLALVHARLKLYPEAR
jgi:hypothetical protein